MSKGWSSKKMKHKHRTRPSKQVPNDYFRAGPVEFARFGKHMFMQSHLGETEIAEMQRHSAARLPEVVTEIDKIVASIAALVRTLPPEEVLKRAWWGFAVAHLGLKSEASVGHVQALAMRMVDYVQSIIAAVPPAQQVKPTVSDEDWNTLTTGVDELFTKVNLDYQICRTAKSRAEDPNLDMDGEAFRFRLEAYWCNICSERYHQHEQQALVDLIIPHNKIIEELFGVTADRVILELTKLLRSLTTGLGDAYKALLDLRDEMLKGIPDTASAEELSSAIAQAMSDDGTQTRAKAVFGKTFGLDLFDVEKVTDLPRTLLDELSWGPGEDTEFFSDGEFRGWPLRVWPIFKRPLIRLGGKYYCFHVPSLFDNFYRVMQRVILKARPDYNEEWNRIQKQTSERLPVDYLRKLLPNAKHFETVHYKWRQDGTTNWCEVDGLLVFEDHLFVIEVKAGAFTYTSPATDLPAHIRSLEALVRRPVMQGRRFVEYLKSAENVPIFDQSHRQIGTLRRSDFRQVTSCAVTLDSLTELAAQAQRLRDVGVDIGNEPIWAVSIDDLRVYSDVFTNPLIFLHFVEKRMQAGATRDFHLDDELDHLGLYLEHNDYCQYAAEISEGARPAEDSGPTHLQFIGYREKIDTYFASKFVGDDAGNPLKQLIPARLNEILEFLAASKTSGRAELASFLLNPAGETRTVVADGIETQLNSNLVHRRSRPLSTHGDVRLTVFCWNSSVPRDQAFALDHTRAVMLINTEGSRVLLELTYSDENALIDVCWRRVDLGGLSEAQLGELRMQAELLRRKRISLMRGDRKIGRNDQCPCGSGRKYKKCCMSS